MASSRYASIAGYHGPESRSPTTGNPAAPVPSQFTMSEGGAIPADLGNVDFTLTLPDEIMAEIFVHGRSTIHVSPYPEARPLEGMVWVLADSPLFLNMRVCRRWRSIIASTPELWSSYSLNPIPTDCVADTPRTRPINGVAIFEDFVSMCFARSGDHPLDLVMGMNPSFGRFRRIIATSDRWRRLTVGLGEVFSMLKSEAFKGFSALRYLDIRGGIPGVDHTAVQATLDAPNLTTLKLWDGAVVQSVKVSTPNVTHMSLRGVDHHHVLLEAAEILSGLPRLSHLSLSCGREVGDALSVISSIPWTFNLPHLQKFAVESIPTVTWSILSRSRLPSLQHLRIEMKPIRRNRADFTQVERDVDVFLSYCPQLESFTAQAVNFTKFKKVLLATRPRFAAFAHDAQPLTSLEVQSFLRNLILGNDGTLERMEEFALFDAGGYDTDQASVFMDTVVGQCLAMAQPNPAGAGDTDRALRRIDVHSPAPIQWQKEDKRQDLYTRGVIPETVQIQLHYSEERSGTKCRVAEDKWSTSTGPVTDEWDNTYYPFMPVL
ncbi:hypothetical protein NMY22_g14638 [Coprinellus aureogranulatus]|nr:hypothetical protein NMY22_g14638 [Coprinellus aureogranulatus]